MHKLYIYYIVFVVFPLQTHLVLYQMCMTDGDVVMQQIFVILMKEIVMIKINAKMVCIVEKIIVLLDFLQLWIVVLVSWCLALTRHTAIVPESVKILKISTILKNQIFVTSALLQLELQHQNTWVLHKITIQTNQFLDIFWCSKVDFRHWSRVSKNRICYNFWDI